VFSRLLLQSFRREKRRKLLAGAAITLGVAVATAMVAVATNVGDAMNRELRSYGANIVIYPANESVAGSDPGLARNVQQHFLAERDLPRMKETFWQLNIIGFSPMLPVRVKADIDSEPVTLLGTWFSRSLHASTGESRQGVRLTHPWWKIRGSWPRDDAGEALIGVRLQKKWKKSPGETIRLSGVTLRLTGTVETGGSEDDMVISDLSVAQRIAGTPGAVGQVFVSALTQPEDELAKRNPATMSPTTLEKWLCSAYAQSIAYQLQEVIPGSRAEQIRQIAQSEGKVLTRISGIMLLITLAAVIAAALAVASAMASAMLERRREIGIMKSLGASSSAVAAVFCSELLLLATMAATAGFFGGVVLARAIGSSVFERPITVQPVLFPVVLSIAIAITFAGAAVPMLRAIRYSPAAVLRGDA
jgi:putative ABC transport system permease protein